MFIPNLLGFPDITMGMGSSGDPTPALKVATTHNRVHRANLTLTGAFDRIATRVQHIMGRDTDNLVLSFHNFWVAQTATNDASNPYTIESLSIQNEAGTVTIPVTFNGGNSSITLAVGDVDIQADPILPSAFGLSKFSRSEKYWIKFIISYGLTAGYVVNNQAIGDVVGQQSFRFGAGTTITSGTYANGAFTTSGDAVGNLPNNYVSVFVLGRPSNIFEKSIIALGDSLTEVTNDTANGGVFGRGAYQRAMRTSTSTDPRPFLNLGTGGSFSTNLTTNRTYALAYFKYADIGIEAYGTNDAAVGFTAAQIYANLENLWNLLKAAGVTKIIRPKYWPRTASTDNYATLANQTPSTGWGVGSKVADLETMFDAAVTAGTITVSPTFSTVRDPSDYWKWIVNGSNFYGTNDGIHYQPVTAELAAADTLRPAIASVAGY